jgi:hypothetical protein
VLRAVADDILAGVMIAPGDLSWIYHLQGEFGGVLAAGRPLARLPCIMIHSWKSLSVISLPVTDHRVRFATLSR